MRVVHSLKQRDTWEALNIKNITIKVDTFSLMGFIRESSDMSALHGGKLQKALCSNASRLLVLPHCLAFSPGILSSLEKKVNVLFQCQHHSKQGFVWETGCSSCNLLACRVPGTHI